MDVPEIVGFDDMVKSVGESAKGTLIIIVGPVGCGKSTLAMKLIKELNGDGDILFVDSLTDMEVLKNTPPENRACLVDELFYISSLLGKVCGLTEYGYIPIVTATNLRYIPRQYRGASREGAGNVMLITFTTRGLFSATHCSMDSAGRLSYRLSKGAVTQEDVDEVKSIANRLLERRAGFR